MEILLKRDITQLEIKYSKLEQRNSELEQRNLELKEENTKLIDLLYQSDNKNLIDNYNEYKKDIEKKLKLKNLINKNLINKKSYKFL